MEYGLQMSLYLFMMKLMAMHGAKVVNKIIFFKINKIHIRIDKFIYGQVLALMVELTYFCIILQLTHKHILNV